MTGLPKHNYPAFIEAEKRFIKLGIRTVNPANLNKKGEPWIVCLKNDLKNILKHCQGVALLPGWRHSKGAKLEVSMAKQLDMVFIDAISLRPLEITLEQQFKQRRI
jgi:hypothetical protein